MHLLWDAGGRRLTGIVKRVLEARVEFIGFDNGGACTGFHRLHLDNFGRRGGDEDEDELARYEDEDPYLDGETNGSDEEYSYLDGDTYYSEEEDPLDGESDYSDDEDDRD